MISKGLNEISNVFKGEQPIEAIYKGTELVWQNFVKGFRKLNYLESTGEQYINTGISAPDGFAAYMKVAVTDNTAKNYFIGDKTSVGETSVYADSATSNSYGFTARARSTYARSNLVPVNGQVYEVEASTLRQGLYVKVDGELLATASVETSRGSSTLKLFATIGGNSPKCRIYELKYYTDDMITLAHHYVPAMRTEDGAVGMYDLIAKEFLTNAGTGEFIYG